MSLVRLNARPNPIPNPRAAVDVSGWDWSWDVWSRVTSAPFAIPGPGTTAIYVEPSSGGCGLENTEGGLLLPEASVLATGGVPARGARCRRH
jgi:hypothetical protein